MTDDQTFEMELINASKPTDTLSPVANRQLQFAGCDDKSISRGIKIIKKKKSSN